MDDLSLSKVYTMKNKIFKSRLTAKMISSCDCRNEMKPPLTP